MHDIKIALVSFQSEFSHLISSLPLFIKGKLFTRLICTIMYLYHIHRYIKYFDEALILSKKYIYLWYLNILDYVIILLFHLYLHHLDNKFLLFIFSIMSGLLSFFFTYLEYFNKVNFSDNIYIDLFVTLSLSLLFLYDKNNQIRFFIIRDLFHHILKFIYFY